MRSLREYVGDVGRKLPAVVDSLELIFGHMYRVGGEGRVYSIGNQQVAIYVVHGTSAIGLAWSKDQMVETIYWWDEFDFGDPNYELVLPPGADIESLIPQIKKGITTKTMGEIS